MRYRRDLWKPQSRAMRAHYDLVERLKKGEEEMLQLRSWLATL